MTKRVLIATLPRHVGETLARAGGLRVLPCPFEIPAFTVKQYWPAQAVPGAPTRAAARAAVPALGVKQ